ncbi:UDP-N-acetylglucosamine 2-epimerase (non-hydrolyzing) [bacterium]|nr:UDP-N-acetylglucosamine 2-epimerase (non-hydrolyzing) [bacterium]
MKIISVVGARPNFMKVAPILRELKKFSAHQSVLVHTGQHYDARMSDIFFSDLQIPEPDVFLNVGSGSHAKQTADVMSRFEEVMQKEKPDLVIVVGDVNSTLACSVTASKMNTKVAHVEAGLRSFDKTMPEEINRIVTDAISDYLFTTEKSGTDHLLKEGKKPEQIYFTGNVMIDSLVFSKERMSKSTVLSQWQLIPQQYMVVTLHRPSNVDNHDSIEKILRILDVIQQKIPVVFPIHPRSLKMIEKFGYQSKIESMGKLKLTDPIGYIDFLRLMSQAKAVVSDSGGLQEESTYLGIPCLTMRENTERPVTIEVGTNTLVGLDEEKIHACIDQIMNGTYKTGAVPQLWDGKAAERIVSILNKIG